MEMIFPPKLRTVSELHSIIPQRTGHSYCHEILRSNKEIMQFLNITAVGSA
jgi:hypothetical protein